MAYKQIQNEWGEWVLQPDNTQPTQKPWEQMEYTYIKPEQMGTQYNYTQPTPYTPQSYTGAVGGTTYANQPALQKYEAPKFDLGKTISDWIGSIKMPWDTTPTPQQGIKPFWEPQPVGASEITPSFPSGSWEAGGMTSGGLRVNKPFEPDEGFGTPQYTFKNLPEVSPQTGQTQIKNLVEQGNDKVMLNTILSLEKSGQKLPEVSPERLNSIQDERHMTDLWDMGYKIPKVLEGAVSEIDNIRRIHPNIMIDTAKLGGLDYANLVNVLTDLNELTSEEWKEIEDRKMSVTLKTTYKGTDAFGKKVYSAKLDVQEPYKTEAEKTAEKEKTKAETKAEREKEEAEEKTKYWSTEEVAERNRRRKESADWQEAQQMEGWSEFYKILGGLKMSPEMDEYFNNPTMFNELRRQWKATGGTWEQFIANYDFDKVWGQLSPSRRGERPAVFAPRMRSVS